MLRGQRKRAHEIVEPAEGRDWASWSFDGLIIGLILLDIFALVGASEPHLRWGRDKRERRAAKELRDKVEAALEASEVEGPSACPHCGHRLESPRGAER